MKHVIARLTLAAAIMVVAAAAACAGTQADDINHFLRENYTSTRAAIVVGLVDEHGSQIFSAGNLR